MSPDLTALALRRHAVRPTPVRRTVLEALAQSPFALSSYELEKQLPPPTDRVTLYRTLRTFEEKGLVHRVIDHSETVRYAATCLDEAAADGPAPAHVHFKCTACQHIYCLSQVAVPSVALPGPYQVVRSDYLLLGVCVQCQAPVQAPEPAGADLAAAPASPPPPLGSPSPAAAAEE